MVVIMHVRHKCARFFCARFADFLLGLRIFCARFGEFLRLVCGFFALGLRIFCARFADFFALGLRIFCAQLDAGAEFVLSPHCHEPSVKTRACMTSI